MNPQTLARLLKFLRMTTSSSEGEMLAALKKANALMLLEGIDWTDLLGGDPDHKDFPQRPPWLKENGTLSPEEMQNLFDAGFQAGKEEGLKEAQPLSALDKALDQDIDSLMNQLDPWNTGHINRAQVKRSNMTSNEIKTILMRAKTVHVSSHNFGFMFSSFEKQFLQDWWNKRPPYSCSIKQEQIFLNISKTLTHHGY